MVTFHVGVLPDRPASDVAELAAMAEDMGYEGLWVADSQSIFRDAYIALAACALRTHRLALATGVTNPITRHPAVVAGAIATLDEIANGRAILGIGVGASSVETIGLSPARLPRLAEYTRVLRALLAGETTAFEGAEIHLSWPVRSVPIYLASSGPRSLQLAGEIADGVVFQVGSNPTFVRFALENVRIGEERGGRPPGTVRRLMRIACAVDEDRDAAHEEIRGYVTVGAMTVFSSIPPERMSPELWEDLRRMKAAYDVHQHGSAGAPQAALITDRIVDSIAIAGTPAEALPRFAELAKMGVDGFVVTATARHPDRLLQTLARTVIEEVS